MLTASVAYQEAVQRSHTYAREVYACEPDGAIIAAVPVMPGASVQVGAGLVRTTLSASIANMDGAFTPASGGLIWWDHPLLVRYGVETGAGMEWVELPLLWPDEPEVDIGARLVRLDCRDALRIVSSESILSRPLTFEEGSGLASAMRLLLERTGAPTDDAAFDLQDGGASFPADSTYEAGSRISSILGQWQVDHRLELYAAPPAVYTLRRVADPLTIAPVVTFARGTGTRLVGFRKRWRNRARNHAIVEGQNSDGRPFRVEAFDLNADSPVRFGAPGVGDLVMVWRSDGITTEEQGMAVARSLIVRNRVEEEVEAQVPVNPALTRNDVVRIEEVETDTTGTFALDTFSLPLSPGAQSFTVRRERSLDA